MAMSVSKLKTWKLFFFSFLRGREVQGIEFKALCLLYHFGLNAQPRNYFLNICWKTNEITLECQVPSSPF